MLHPDAPHRTIEQREAAIDIPTASQLLIGMFRCEGFSMLPDVPSVALKMDKLVEGYHVYPERQMPHPILTNVLTPDSRSMALAFNEWDVRPFSFIKNQLVRQAGEFDPLVDGDSTIGLLESLQS